MKKSKKIKLIIFGSVGLVVIGLVCWGIYAYYIYSSVSNSMYNGMDDYEDAMDEYRDAMDDLDYYY